MLTPLSCSPPMIIGPKRVMSGYPISYSIWTPQRTSAVDSSTWDDKWITLVRQYFGLLRWPDEIPPNDAGISLLEIMLYLCISFQVRPPITAAVSKLRLPEVPVLPPKSPAKYVLLSRAACSTLPPDILTASAHTSLLTFDFLYPRMVMTPYPRENLRSLAGLGFSNVVLSWRPLRSCSLAPRPSAFCLRPWFLAYVS